MTPEVTPEATAEATIERGGVELATAHRTQLCRLQHRIFSTSPFVTSVAGPDAQESVFDELLKCQGFAVCLARLSGRVVGFAYGHRLPADHLWWGGFPVPLAEELTAEWDGRTFTLVDLAVHEDIRRQGLGRRLVEGLLADRPEERVLLSTQPAASAAHAFYRATGWQLIGRKGPIEGVVPPYWDIFMRRLPDGGLST